MVGMELEVKRFCRMCCPTILVGKRPILILYDVCTHQKNKNYYACRSYIEIIKPKNLIDRGKKEQKSRIKTS